MKVAIVGGTGDFGLALAARLVEAGDDVVIGSRDAARAQEKANEVGCRGDSNEAAVGDAELAVLATVADAALAAAQTLRSFFRSPVLSVASELEFHDRLARPPAQARSLAERIDEVVDVSVVAGLPLARRRRSSRTAAPTRTRSSAATTTRRRRLRSSSLRRWSRAARSMPGRSRAPARSRA